MPSPERLQLAWCSVGMIVFARRASPGWGALARDYAAGVPVPPARFFPFHDLRFSREIPDLIERWNRLAAVSYFECRARLCEIADSTLARVDGAIRIDWTEVPAFLANRSDERLLLFYHDDDDWFHPSLERMLGGIDISAVDAVVFPFLRLARSLTTFSFQGAPTAAAIGRCEVFRYRYCTNNYGLTARALARSVDLVEHTQASETAEALGFVDMQVDAVVSATNKTPCSASWLFRLPGNKAGFDRYIRAYVETLEGISIPTESRWIQSPLRQTIDLFESVVG
ncbi:hypothetical protein [Marilutibacter chinensis]|uniref:Capsular polysaccharide synthesis protein n=1 Tax=Marilutibacter chinensis TaxID=2912247 RepID=A0ABS9I053_9GAMM|nr:hypothetical protein [Lysobacter chinensis]MCF7223759.1 hypothetical protein [Lysobacter chinensis]